MIVTLKVSDRRFYVLEVPRLESSWTSAVGEIPSPRGHLGYISARAEIIAGPVDSDSARRAAILYAQEHGQLIEHKQWEVIKAKAIRSLMKDVDG